MLKHDRNLWYITVETLLLDVTLHSGLGYITFSPAFGVFMKEDDSSHDSLLLYCTSLRMFGFWWQDDILNTHKWYKVTLFFFFFFYYTFVSLLPLSQNQSLYKISHFWGGFFFSTPLLCRIHYLWCKFYKQLSQLWKSSHYLLSESEEQGVFLHLSQSISGAWEPKESERV